jgi:hypothetical protein
MKTTQVITTEDETVNFAESPNREVIEVEVRRIRTLRKRRDEESPLVSRLTIKRADLLKAMAHLFC